MIKIRRATMKDLKHIQELFNSPELLNPDGSVSHIFWLKGFIREKQLFFIAEKNRKPIGFVIAERTTGRLVIIHAIGVMKKEREKGIGQKLLNTVEEEAKKGKAKAIMLRGYAKNKKSLHFFEKNKYIKGSLTYEFIKYIK